MTARLARTSIAAGAHAARVLLADPAIDALEIPYPALDDQPYRDFVHALLQKPGFKLALNAQSPADALALASDQLLGPGMFVEQRAALAAEIARLVDFSHQLTSGPPPLVSIRTYFAPGDTVWHLDRSGAHAAFRLLWPLGRPVGMAVTPPENIDQPLHRAYMHREYPLLCQLDTRVLRTGASAEALWAHRPAQLAAMMNDRFPFLRDPSRESTIAPHAASIHRVETQATSGTYHRSSWANRTTPGLQVVITTASNDA